MNSPLSNAEVARKERRGARRAEGLCLRCGVVRPAAGRLNCAACNGKRREGVRLFQETGRYYRPETVEERFWRQVDKSPGLGPQGECWEWRGFRDDDGYGHFKIDGASPGAHRIAFELSHRSLLPTEKALHRCENPPCVRPNHLFAGSVADNNRDKCNKGRQAKGKGGTRKSSVAGELNPRARLRDEQIEYIRNSFASGAASRAALAKEHLVSRNYINKVIRGAARPIAGKQGD